MTLGDVRDIAIVVLGAVSLITILVFIVTALLVWRLIAAIRTDIGPIFASVRDTANTVRATVDLVRDTVDETTRPSTGVFSALRRAAKFARGRFS